MRKYSLVFNGKTRLRCHRIPFIHCLLALLPFGLPSPGYTARGTLTHLLNRNQPCASLRMCFNATAITQPSKSKITDFLVRLWIFSTLSVFLVRCANQRLPLFFFVRTGVPAGMTSLVRFLLTLLGGRQSPCDLRCPADPVQSLIITPYRL